MCLSDVSARIARRCDVCASFLGCVCVCLVGDYGTSEHSETLIYGCYNVIMLYSNVTMEAAAVRMFVDHIVEAWGEKYYCHRSRNYTVSSCLVIPAFLLVSLSADM